MGTFILILATLLSNPEPTIKPNSIGLVYLNEQQTGTTELKIVFPFNTFELANFNYGSYIIEYFESNKIIEIPFSGELRIEDEQGELLKLTGRQTFKLEFWCENDGGTQFRPTLTVNVPSSSFKRTPKLNPELQNLIGVVIANQLPNSSLEPINEQNLPDDIWLRGDLNDDGLTDAFVYTFYDEAENCDGEPANNLVVMLGVGQRSFWMRCCGP